MVGFIKKLFTGIISFFTGLVSGKKSEENKPSKLSPVEKLTEATTSSAEKLAEATTSSAEKLAEATTKTSKEILSSFTSNKSEENKPATDKAEKPAANAKNRKRNGYFMELDESEEMPSVNSNQPAKVEVAKTPEPAKTAKTAKTAKPEPAKTQSPADKSKTVELVQTATEVKEVVKTEPAKPATAASGNGQAQSENTFAPKYLTPTNSNSRRRPGPSMSNFLNMARQVKTAK